MTTYHDAGLPGLNNFYREAGSATSPSIVVLHGFPSSSHRFGELISQCADHVHIAASDYLGFGSSNTPAAGEFCHTSRGQDNPFFTAAGAQAYLRDLPEAELHPTDGGHFLLEEHSELVAPRIIGFQKTVQTVGGGE